MPRLYFILYARPVVCFISHSYCCVLLRNLGPDSSIERHLLAHATPRASFRLVADKR